MIRREMKFRIASLVCQWKDENCLMSSKLPIQKDIGQKRLVFSRMLFAMLTRAFGFNQGT